MIETRGYVVSNDETSSGYRLMVLRFEEEIRLSAGQFAMVKPAGSFEPLLRRALAVYQSDGGKTISFLYQVLGRGTTALSRLRESEVVEALIPLGNSWPVAENNSSADSPCLIVSGGIGSASLLMLCEELKRKAHRNTTVFFGAATSSTARGCGLEDFQRTGFRVVVTTDDGSLGERGLVTAPFEQALKETRGSGVKVYACGPWPMMRRVAELSRDFEAVCYASLEAPMGCGFGVCVGCVVAVQTQGVPGYGSYQRVCLDGPIFPAEKIRWEIDAMGH